MTEKQITVDYYFDYSCPWTYLSYKRLNQTVLRTASLIRWKPIEISYVRSLIKKKEIEIPQALSNYRTKDLQDWATYCSLKIEIQKDTDHCIARKALQGAFLAIQKDKIYEYSGLVFKSYFGKCLDISNIEILLNIGKKSGLDEQEFLSIIETSPFDKKLKSNAEELIDRGGFGSPTMFVEDKMFFGNDRMNLVEFAIGQASGKILVIPGQHNS